MNDVVAFQSTFTSQTTAATAMMAMLPTVMPVPISHSHMRTYNSKKSHVQLMKPKLNYGNRNQIGIRYIPSVDFGSLVLELPMLLSSFTAHNMNIYIYANVGIHMHAHRTPHILTLAVQQKKIIVILIFDFGVLANTHHIYTQYTYRL